MIGQPSDPGYATTPGQPPSLPPPDDAPRGPGPAIPVPERPSDEVKRKTVMVLLDVCNLRRLSAAAWAVTWGIFLILIAFAWEAIGSETSALYDAYNNLYTLSELIVLVILVPAAISIIIGFFSSLRWGQEFRELVGDPRRLHMAWLPGVRASKRDWNRSRMFLWVSWGLGLIVILVGVFELSALLYTSYTCTNVNGVETCQRVITPGMEILVGSMVAAIIVFLVFRGLHHHFFARSAIHSVVEVAQPFPQDYWAKEGWWWTLGTFSLPFDPVFLYLLALYSTLGLGLAGNAYYVTALGVVTLGGVVCLGASLLLIYGYTQIGNACRMWLSTPRQGAGPTGGTVPPEWFT